MAPAMDSWLLTPSYLNFSMRFNFSSLTLNKLFEIHFTSDFTDLSEDWKEDFLLNHSEGGGARGPEHRSREFQVIIFV